MSTTVKTLIPHLFFDGVAAKAIAHYERALGAEVLALARWGEMPGGDLPPADREKVMHARLRIGQAYLLVADSTRGAPSANANGTVMLELDDAREMEQRFAALAEGGTVSIAIHDAFWGARFGALVDPFGVSWMFHCEKKETER